MTSQANRLPPLSGNKSVTQDIKWMQYALALAKKGAEMGEVPVAAVLVYHDEVIAEAHNAPIMLSDPTAHAEMLVLRQAAAKLKNYRLLDTTLYVTLEPCLMCAGAMVHARIKQLVYGAADLKTGAVQSVDQVFDKPFLNHRVSYQGGVWSEACGSILSQFFQSKR